MYSRYNGRLVTTFVVLLAATLGACLSAPRLPPDRKPTPNTLPIIPGEGVKGCRVGEPARGAVGLFGKPSAEGASLLAFADKGVELGVDDGKVDALFFYYRSRTYKEYAGKTDKGIGKRSSIEDVVKQYGKPDRVGESIVSESGDKPGAKECHLDYTKMGIAFTFYDKELAVVRVFAKNDSR